LSKQTSAPTTAFCSARVDGPGGFHLWIDGNGKITAANGSLDAPMPNAFSLQQIADCPGSTPTCRNSCYVHSLEKHAPATYGLYAHNSGEIRKILDDSDIFLAVAWANHLGQWIAEHCQGGFRWHVSGDVFSAEYAAWIAAVCVSSPSVRHWIYTRSFGCLNALADARNLTVNLSCDRDNFAEAVAAAHVYGLRLCYLTVDGEVPAQVGPVDTIFPDYTLRGDTEWFNGLAAHQKKAVCPVDFHGKSETRRCGPCSRCIDRSVRG